MIDSALTLAPLPASRIDDLVPMWRTSFETGVGIKGRILWKSNACGSSPT